MREENLALIERGYDAFAKGDLDTIRLMASPDVIWRTPGFGPLEADYKGIDGVIGYLTALFTLTDGTFHTMPLHMFADDERVTVIERVTAVRGSLTLDAHVVHVFEIHDGKVWEIVEYAAEPKLLEAFWA